MDYKKTYETIIDKAKNLSQEREQLKRNKQLYFEKHHIIPKCIGGTNNTDNLVLLTAREHFICHKLLCEIHKDNNKLIYALWRMGSGHPKRYKVGNREYEKLKTRMALATSQIQTNIKRSEEWKRKQSEAKKGRISVYKGQTYEKRYGKNKAEKIKRKIANNKLRAEKISLALKKRVFSEEHKRNLRKPKNK